jgi:non-specific serine/threonine protein kinase
VQKFQEQERSKLFFISLKAGGVGLNITILMFCFGPLVESLKSKVLAASYWTVEQSKCFDSLHKNTVEEKIRLQKTKILSDALLDENHQP